ncbi:methyltransferase domain-containing protein [Roseiflexus sp.]|uniref:methyltransferase domain-containing protein n=1 Tax=Roseiflexus sp. TaxID=2562120 RepID=UPI00398AA2F1
MTSTPTIPAPDEALRFLDQVRILEDNVDHDIRNSAPQELSFYRLIHLRTWLRALHLVYQAFPVIERPLRILELGASPYFFTALLAHHIPCEIVTSTLPALTWPGEPLKVRPYSVVIACGDDRPPLRFQTWTFNIEKDNFPFADGSFDLVLCMEVMEHLTYNPSHTLAETHRVLCPGGKLLVTIPNYLRSQRIVQVALGRPDDFPYVGTGIQGRHQRELTYTEVKILLEACNYHIDYLDVEIVWPWSPAMTLAGRVFAALLHGFLRLPLAYARNRRELIIALATPVGEPRLGYPPQLYDDPMAFPQEVSFQR